MKKQIKIAALMAGALLGAAALAGAATDVNLYGSSAQYPYWSAQGPDFFNSQYGCNLTPVAVQGTTAGGVAVPGVTGVTCYSAQFNGCSTTSTDLADNSGIINFRYCSNSSVTGIQSVLQQTGKNTTDSCGDTKRDLLNSDGTHGCQTIHAGLSDVAGEAFTQSSNGNKTGPLSSANFTPSYSGQTTAGLTPHNTVVTPFAFYVNSSVTATMCDGGLVGNLCASNADCTPTAGASFTTPHCNTTAATINNLSRIEAVMLFSGQVADWSYLGGYYTANPVTLCYRHAGSGTHATLQYAVMNQAWGAGLPTLQSTGSPTIWFNNATGDEVNCINGDNNVTASTPNGSLTGAVGYADANITLGVANKSQNVVQVKYNGFYPTRSHVRNGQYDFYAVSYLYTNDTKNSSYKNLMANMVTYAANPAKIPTALANFWPAQSEMWFTKATDFNYPGGVTASNPQSP
jgi:hypothetical protein